MTKNLLIAVSAILALVAIITMLIVSILGIVRSTWARDAYRTTEGMDEQKVVYYFYKPNCPFCVAFNRDGKDAFAKKVVSKGYRFADIDIASANIQHGDAVAYAYATSGNIKTVPHITMYKNGVFYQYGGDRSKSDLSKWIDTL